MGNFMKIFNINLYNLNFKGKRQDRNTVSQLKTDNPYDLNVPNQRRINEAIDNLGNVPGDDNINFLVDVSDNLKYGTNINLGKNSYNDWNKKLKSAAEKSLSLSDSTVQEKLSKKVQESFQPNKPLTAIEKDILAQRKELLTKIDFKSLDKISNSNIKNIKTNLDYFVVSSEVPTSQKLYILKRFNYFMSDDYKINPQLEGRKSQALAEMVNDIVVNTPESKVPNIKAINQKQHGICAVISIARKLMAYEDKANYVDMVMSELDASDYLQVYDITNLGSHKKVPIPKSEIDFNYALSKGYRILDTSSMYWMSVADTVGSNNDIVGAYLAFDKRNFDVWNDSHLKLNLGSELGPKQDYFRSLMKAKESLEKIKKSKIANKYKSSQYSVDSKNNVETITKYNKLLLQDIRNISPNTDSADIREIMAQLLKLEVKNSKKITQVNNYSKDFTYIPNESKNVKLEKIKAFLSVSLPDKNSKMLDKKAPEILELVDNIHELTKSSSFSHVDKELARAKNLYSAAAAYRLQYITQLGVGEELERVLEDANLPDEDKMISDNLGLLIQQLEKGKMNPIVKEQLTKYFPANDKETLLDALYKNKDALDYIRTDFLDNLYHATLGVNRKISLSIELKNLEKDIDQYANKYEVAKIAKRLKVKNNKVDIRKQLEKYISILESENCSEEQFQQIYKLLGHNSPRGNFKEHFEDLGKIMFEEHKEDVIRGFNVANGAPADAPIEKTLDLYKNLIKRFNETSTTLARFMPVLRVVDNDGQVLNSPYQKDAIIKKLEDIGEIPTVQELKTLNEKFTRIDKAKADLEESGRVKNKDLPKELTTFSPYEKSILKKYDNNVGFWYSNVTRKLNYEYKDIKEPLSDMHRQIGLLTGCSWDSEGHSGLNSRQQIKIIEHMTDKPYYIEHDGHLALKKLKDSPYSAISSTSVHDKEIACHAQYVADVKPIQIKSSGKVMDENIILHDNTWGASEHENTWEDEKGITRTDYNNGYGGKNGFVTDENYRNGQLSGELIDATGKFEPDNIPLKAYKKLNKADSEDYDFQMFNNMIMPGKHPNAMKYVRMIRENTLISSYSYLDDLQKYANGMTQAELKAAMKKVEINSEGIQKIYTSLIDRINGDKIISQGITNVNQYNKIPESDPLKIILEKAAIFRSYSDIPETKKLTNAEKVSDINKIKAIVKQEARKNFNYTFAKDIDIAQYGAEKSRDDIYKLLENVEQTYNIKLNNKEKLQIVNSMKKIPASDFDGSLSHTINLMTKEFVKKFNEKTPDFDNKQVVTQNLANEIKNILETKMGFTLADLSDSSFESGNLKSIVNWIDRTFEPATNEEFVQIFNNLRNMTSKEFNALYDSKISNKDLGIKNISGYDILKEIRANNSKTLDTIFNIIFNTEYYKNREMSDTIPTYDYHKFSRNYHGGKYVNGKRSFDDIYSDYYFSLRTLTLEKRYDAMKQQAFEMYGVYPAYPKVDSQNKEFAEKLLKALHSDLCGDIESIDAYKIIMQSAQIVKNIDKKLDKYELEQTLTPQQKASIIRDYRTFMDINEGDNTIENLIKEIKNVIENGKTTQDFKSVNTKIMKEISPYLTTLRGQPLDEAIKSRLESIEDQSKDFIMNSVEPKYQERATSMLKKWIKARIKDDVNNTTNSEDAFDYSDSLYEQFAEYVEKHLFLSTPENVLNNFLLMNAKDARPKNLNATSEDAVEAMEDFESLKDFYKVNLKNLLFNANLVELQSILMKCAKNGNLNIVKDTLENSKLDLTDGTTIPMNSDKAISILFSPLLADSASDTAVMFINQLGIGEKIAEIAVKNSDFNTATKNIKRINNIFDSVSKQSKIIEKELNKLQAQGIDDNPNYEEEIRKTKDIVQKKGLRTNYRKSLKVYMRGFDLALDQMKQQPEMSKLEILTANMNIANSAAVTVAKNDVQYLNENLAKVQKWHDLLVRLSLPENSKASEIRKNFLDEFNKVEKYRQNTAKNYSQINIET